MIASGKTMAEIAKKLSLSINTVATYRCRLLEKMKMQILILIMKAEEDYGLRYLKSGASGCLAKECEVDELKKAIRELAKGNRYISPSLAEKIALDLVTGKEKKDHKVLSNREYQVMCLIASGKRLKEIAEELSLNVKTISTVRACIMKKMN